MRNFLLTALILLTLLAIEPHVQAEDSSTAKSPPPIGQQFQQLLGRAVPLNPDKTLFLDRETKALYLGTEVVLTAGMLEMLCCPQQTKEHESILSTSCPAQLVHAGLLVLNAEPGQPAQYGDPFQPPKGEKLELTLFWFDQNGKLQQQDARKWIRTATRRYFSTALETLPAGFMLPDDSELRFDDARSELLHYGILTKELRDKYLKLTTDMSFRAAIEKLHEKSQPRALEADWVFVGSAFQQDPVTGQQRYMAEGGDMICVANFPAAMIDVAIRSSASDDSRGYEANSDVVPPLGTPVLLKLQRSKDVTEARK